MTALLETDGAAAGARVGRGPHLRFPRQAEYEQGVPRVPGHIRAGRRVPDRPLAARERPTPLALDLYRALRRVNPSPYLFLLELDGSRSSAPRPRRS